MAVTATGSSFTWHLTITEWEKTALHHRKFWKPCSGQRDPGLFGVDGPSHCRSWFAWGHLAQCLSWCDRQSSRNGPQSWTMSHIVTPIMAQLTQGPSVCEAS